MTALCWRLWVDPQHSAAIMTCYYPGGVMVMKLPFNTNQYYTYTALAWTNEPTLNGLNYQNCNYQIFPKLIDGCLPPKLIELTGPRQAPWPDTCWPDARPTHSCLERFSPAFPCYAPSVGWWCQPGSGHILSSRPSLNNETRYKIHNSLEVE